jgi:hypothetical protein
MNRCPLLRIAVDLLPRRILQHRTVYALASQHPLNCRHVPTRASWRSGRPTIRLSTDCSDDDDDDDGDGSDGDSDRHVRITTHDTSSNRVVRSSRMRMRGCIPMTRKKRALKKRRDSHAVPCRCRDVDCAAISDTTGNFETRATFEWERRTDAITIRYVNQYEISKFAAL